MLSLSQPLLWRAELGALNGVEATVFCCRLVRQRRRKPSLL